MFKRFRNALACAVGFHQWMVYVPFSYRLTCSRCGHMRRAPWSPK